MPVPEHRSDRHRVVADVVRAEWTPLDGFEWTPERVAEVDEDLASGHEENHFHEAVPHVQFGLRTLAAAGPDTAADDAILAELVSEYFPEDADRAPRDDYIRFGLRVLAHARGEDWNAPQERRSFVRRLFGTR